MAEISGKWLLVNCEGVEEFCKELVTRIPVEELHTVEYCKDGENNYTQTLHYGTNFLQLMWYQDYGPQKFVNGVEFCHKDLSGSDAKSTITVDGNIITQLHSIGGDCDGAVEIKIERVFNGDKMTTTVSEPCIAAKIVWEFVKV